MDSAYVLSFVGGIFTFVSPCILPLIPLYLVYLGGSDNSTDEKNKGRLFLNSIGFVIGMTLVFVALGAAATSLGAFLRDHKSLLKIISSIVMIFFGVNFVVSTVYETGFLNKVKRFEYKFNSLRFFSSVIFGMVFAFGWTPCVGQFLTPILGLAANSNTLSQGILLLTLYSLGLGIPFIITSLAFDSLKGAFKIIQKYNRIINLISGILLIVFGLALLFNII